MAIRCRNLEILSLMVATLCHDLDHRGTNNAFQVSAVRRTCDDLLTFLLLLVVLFVFRSLRLLRCIVRRVRSWRYASFCVTKM